MQYLPQIMDCLCSKPLMEGRPLEAWSQEVWFLKVFRDLLLKEWVKVRTCWQSDPQLGGGIQSIGYAVPGAGALAPTVAGVVAPGSQGGVVAGQVNWSYWLHR